MRESRSMREKERGREEERRVGEGEIEREGGGERVCSQEGAGGGGEREWREVHVNVPLNTSCILEYSTVFNELTLVWQRNNIY